MTPKEYFRQINFRDLGYPLDSEYKILEDSIIANIKSLNSFTVDTIKYVIFYGRNIDEILFKHNVKNNTIEFETNIRNSMIYKNKLTFEDYCEIYSYYLSKLIGINAEIIK